MERMISNETNAAMDLVYGRKNPLWGLSKHDSQGRCQEVGLRKPEIDSAGGSAAQPPKPVEIQERVCETVLHRLEGSNGPTELISVPHMVGREVKDVFAGATHLCSFHNREKGSQAPEVIDPWRPQNAVEFDGDVDKLQPRLAEITGGSVGHDPETAALSRDDAGRHLSRIAGQEANDLVRHGPIADEWDRGVQNQTIFRIDVN
jgi:hypothetical protein